MPRQEDIRNTIWLDLDGLSNEAMLLYIWSWTNERCGPSGFYSCPKRLLLEGRLEDRVDEVLAECVSAGKLMYEDGVLWSITRVKRLPWKTAQAAKGIANELAELDPDNPIHAAFVERYDGHPWGKNGEGRLTLSQESGEGGPGVDQGSGEGKPSPGSGSIPEAAEGSPTLGQGSQVKANGEGKGKGSGRGTSTTAVDSEKRAPEQVRDALDGVVEALGRIAEARAWPFPDTRRVSAAMATYPDADHRAVVADMEDWLCESDHGKRAQISDLVQAFRNQLQRKQPTGSPAGGGEKPGDPETDEAYARAMEPAA